MQPEKIRINIGNDWAGLKPVMSTEWHGRIVEIPHRFERSKFSGAGNCWCGHAEHSEIHQIEGFNIAER